MGGDPAPGNHGPAVWGRCAPAPWHCRVVCGRTAGAASPPLSLRHCARRRSCGGALRAALPGLAPPRARERRSAIDDGACGCARDGQRHPQQRVNPRTVEAWGLMFCFVERVFQHPAATQRAGNQQSFYQSYASVAVTAAQRVVTRALIFPGESISTCVRFLVQHTYACRRGAYRPPFWPQAHHLLRVQWQQQLGEMRRHRVWALQELLQELLRVSRCAPWPAPTIGHWPYRLRQQVPACAERSHRPCAVQSAL